MAFLTPDKIRNEYGLEIKEKIIPNGNKLKSGKKLSKGTGKVEWVTIHNTNDIDEAEGTNDAEQYMRATYNGNMNGVTVHYYIDETDCWQLLYEDEIGAHAADYDGPGNTTSLAIEIIMDGSGFKADVEAERRGALLAAILLHRNGLGIDRLTTHNHWYPSKYCPAFILPHWESFKNQVEVYLREIQAAEVVGDGEVSGGASYIVQAGAFLSSENAEMFKKEIINKGFDACIVYVEPHYLVRVGTFSIEKNAEAYKTTLGAAGIDCVIIEDKKTEEIKVVEQEKFTAADAREALRMSVGLEEVSKETLERYDVDGDGKITATDAREILRESVGLE